MRDLQQRGLFERVDFHPLPERLLFLYPAFLFLTVFGGGMIQDGLYRVLLLVTTGSILAK